jgi:hypothetical protein
MARRRRWEEELDREAERAAKPPLARQLSVLDEGKRAGVLEELQSAGGNRALQQVVGGLLQRDTATTAQRPSSVGGRAATRWMVSLDGTAVPVAAVSGGGVQSEVITERADPSGHVLKHIGAVEYEPVELLVGANLGGLGDWLHDTFASKLARRDLVIHQLDADGKVLASLEAQKSLITEVEVPALDVRDTGSGWLRIKLQPEFTRRTTASGSSVKVKGAPEALKPSTARLDVSGIGAVAELKSVAPWTFKQGIKRLEVGESRDYQQEPTQTKLGDLVVTLAESAKGAGTKGFDAWFQENMKGNADERTVVLTVSGEGGRKLELTFSGVGIFSADQLSRSEVGGRRYGLYVERVSL